MGNRDKPKSQGILILLARELIVNCSSIQVTAFEPTFTDALSKTHYRKVINPEFKR